jgi:hypothetical protein
MTRSPSRGGDSGGCVYKPDEFTEMLRFCIDLCLSLHIKHGPNEPT